MLMTGTYDPFLVSLSYIVAAIASYTALELARRVASSQGKAATMWLISGSFSMGIGIWTMHFVGMLAFSMPMAFTYDVPLTILSLLVAVAASAFTIFIASRAHIRLSMICLSGVLLGCGIAGMHYTGMAAMRMQATIVYDNVLVAASVAIAIGAATAAIWIAFTLVRVASKHLIKMKICAAMIMGIAIWGMHYTGMFAAKYLPLPGVVMSPGAEVDQTIMAVTLAIAAIMILGVTHLTIFFDYRLNAQTVLGEKLALMVTEREAARDQALAMSRSKSEFLARMSHEIRTPMNGVLGMTELLLNTPLDSGQQRFAETIYESAESLLDIINDILDFSKIEAGKLQLELVDVHLRSILEETVDGLAGHAHRKGLELINKVPPDLYSSVQADPGRLRQVLTNLVGNAIKFTEEGEVAVELTVAEADSDHLNVCFDVSDTGIGIQRHKRDEIFESFTQEDGTTTRLYGGTRLGLAISRQLVELMGGQLTVKSTLGEGSTFSFVLCMEKGCDSLSAASTQLQYIAGKRVMLVDDNETNREILEHQLGSWRALTDSASSAKEALVIFRVRGCGRHAT